MSVDPRTLDVCPECGVQGGHGVGCPAGPDAAEGVTMRVEALGAGVRRIGVLVPTVTGREDHLARCVASHCPPATSVEWLLAVELDHPTCGEAWVAGVDRLLAAGAEYVLISCDDFEAVGPYWHHAVHLADRGHVCCPILHNVGEPQRWHSSVLDGEPGEAAACTRSPNLLTAEACRRVFDVYRQVEPLQYYGDFLIGDIAGRLGMPATVTPGFTFIHWWAQVGRHSDEQNARDHDTYKRVLARLDSELIRSQPHHG